MKLRQIMLARVADDKNDDRVLVQIFRDLQRARRNSCRSNRRRKCLRGATSWRASSNDSRSVILMISSIMFISALPTGRLCPMPSTRYGVASGTCPVSL